MRPGAARRLVTFLARPRKVTERRPPLDSRPVFTGCPCAACLDEATAELDLARRKQRASLLDRVLAPAPANGAALNVSTGAQSSPKSPYQVELLGAPQGEIKSIMQ